MISLPEILYIYTVHVQFWPTPRVFVDFPAEKSVYHICIHTVLANLSLEETEPLAFRKKKEAYTRNVFKRRSLTVPSTKAAPFPSIMWGVVYCLRSFSFPSSFVQDGMQRSGSCSNKIARSGSKITRSGSCDRNEDSSLSLFSKRQPQRHWSSSHTPCQPEKGTGTGSSMPAHINHVVDNLMSAEPY